MTTVAFKEGVLAADTLTTCNGYESGFETKIHRLGRLLIGGAGSVAAYETFRDWVAGGMRGQHPLHGRDVGNHFIVRPNGATICWCCDGPFRMAAVWALGTGELVAMGAMLAGKSARQAVTLAAKHDTRTGGKITILRL